jgi:hypothetical protein
MVAAEHTYIEEHTPTLHFLHCSAAPLRLIYKKRNARAHSLRVNITLTIARINPTCCHYLLGRQSSLFSLVVVHTAIIMPHARHRERERDWVSRCNYVSAAAPKRLIASDAPRFALQIYALCVVSMLLLQLRPRM